MSLRTIKNMGEEKIEEHGFCWSETQKPLLSDDSVSLGETEKKGLFSTPVEGLKALSTYFVRAYAITSKEIFYGNEQMFTTTALAVPTVRTQKVIHFDRHSAVCGG